MNPFGSSFETFPQEMCMTLLMLVNSEQIKSTLHLRLKNSSFLNMQNETTVKSHNVPKILESAPFGVENSFFPNLKHQKQKLENHY